MDSDSDSDSGVRSSGTPILPSPNQSDPQYERGPLGKQYLVVDHTASLTAGAKVSGLWHHGGERRRTDNGSWDRWPLHEEEAIQGQRTRRRRNSYAVRHLRNKHISMIFLLHQFLRHYFLIGKSPSRALVSLDPEGEGGGCLTSPHRCESLAI
jgi:hypothetical protein